MTPAHSPSRFVKERTLTPRRTVPFEYAFRCDLTGRRDNVINRTVTVSIEATFVAVSIGYGLVPKVAALTFGPKLSAPIILATTPGKRFTLRDVIGPLVDGLDAKLPETSRLLKRETGAEAVLKNGFKLNPDIVELALQNGGNIPLDASVLENLSCSTSTSRCRRAASGVSGGRYGRSEVSAS